MVVGWILAGLQGLLAVGMGAAGGMKLARRDQVVEEFEKYGYSQSFMLLTGGIEAVASLALFAGFVMPTVALAGGAVALAVMVGALFTHYRIDDPLSEAAPAVVLFVISAVVTAGVATTAGVV